MSGKFGRRAAVIAGVAMTPQGDLSDRTAEGVYWEVVKAALADAGLGLTDIDGLVGDAPEGPGLRRVLPGGAVADAIGRPLRFHSTTALGASASAAGVGLAVIAVEQGLADVVIVPTVAAVSRITAANQKNSRRRR